VFAEEGVKVGESIEQATLKKLLRITTNLYRRYVAPKTLEAEANSE